MIKNIAIIGAVIVLTLGTIDAHAGQPFPIQSNRSAGAPCMGFDFGELELLTFF